MMDGFVVRRLTYAGHEFLDAAREDKLWNKAKQNVLSNAGNCVGWPFVGAGLRRICTMSKRWKRAPYC